MNARKINNFLIVFQEIQIECHYLNTRDSYVA